MATNVITFVIKGIDLASPVMKGFASNVSRQFSRIKGAASKLTAFVKKLTIAFVALAAGAFFIIRPFIRAASVSENLKVRLQVLLGSVGEGNRLFKEMATFAAGVSFEFEELMEAATTMAGVVQGGVDEVMQFMPMISDLAAVSGLSIKETTGQIVRMFSAGAGAADLFRERGILNMLGFTSGVAISAGDTKKKLIEAFEAVDSKFRGTTELLAKTWDGMLSMLSDKWFQFRNVIMEGGLFDFFKAIVKIIDQDFKKVLEDGEETGKAWSRAIINGILNVASAVSFMADSWRVIRIVWIGLKVAWAQLEFLIKAGIDGVKSSWFFLAEGMNDEWSLVTTEIQLLWSFVQLGFAASMKKMSGWWQSFINFILGGYNELINKSPWLADKLGIEKAALSTFGESFEKTFDDAVSKVEELQGVYASMLDRPDKIWNPAPEVQKAANEVMRLTQELLSVWDQPMPSTGIDDWVDRVKEQFAILQEEGKKVQESLRDEDGAEETLLFWDEFWDEMGAKMDTFQEKQGNFVEEFARSIFKLMIETTKAVGTGIAEVIIEGKKIGDVIKNIMKSVLKGIIANYITLKIQKFIAAKADIGLAGANMLATMSLAPFPINLTAPAFAQAHATQAAIYAGSVAAAHGGLTNVPNEATYLLTGGERVLSPKQNVDFTDFIQGNTQDNKSSGITEVVIPELPPLFKMIQEVVGQFKSAVKGFSDFGTRELAPILKQVTEQVYNEHNFAQVANNQTSKSATTDINITEGDTEISITIYTTASNFEDIDDVEIEDFVAGKIIPTLDRLDDQGIRQRALERSNA